MAMAAAARVCGGNMSGSQRMASINHKRSKALAKYGVAAMISVIVSEGGSLPFAFAAVYIAVEPYAAPRRTAHRRDSIGVAAAMV